MRFFLSLLLTAVLLGAAWNNYITKGGMVAYYDKHPKAASGANMLYYLAKYYEMGGRWDQTLALDKRVVERYPTSPHAMDAHFGMALALEKLNRYPEAIEEYQKFLEKYPRSPYAVSVRNNVEILKSR